MLQLWLRCWRRGHLWKLQWKPRQTLPRLLLRQGVGGAGRPCLFQAPSSSCTQLLFLFFFLLLWRSRNSCAACRKLQTVSWSAAGVAQLRECGKGSLCSRQIPGAGSTCRRSSRDLIGEMFGPLTPLRSGFPASLASLRPSLALRKLRPSLQSLVPEKVSLAEELAPAYSQARRNPAMFQTQPYRRRGIRIPTSFTASLSHLYDDGPSYVLMMKMMRNIRILMTMMMMMMMLLIIITIIIISCRQNPAALRSAIRTGVDMLRAVSADQPKCVSDK